MKRLLACILGVGIVGCSMFTAANLDRLRAAELAACFIAHAALPSSREIAIACQVGPEFVDMIAKVVGEHNAAVTRELHNAGACRPALAGDASPMGGW